jgi:hypothetical protein
MNESSGPSFSEFNRQTVVGLIGIGVIGALLIYGLSMLLSSFIIGPALCRSASESVCSQSTTYSYHIAAIITGIIAVVGLVKLFVYRPLFVALALLIGSWPLYDTFLPSLSWPWALASLLFINIIGYVTFSWLLRSYTFLLSLVFTVVVTIALFVVSR